MPLVLQVFLFRDGQFLGTEMATGERLEIGRDATCDIVLQDEGASRKHALLFEAGGQVAIQDLGSANGTTLNGARLSAPAYVGARDDIGIGRYTIKVKLMASAARSGPEPVAAPPPTRMASGQTPAAPASVDDLISGPNPVASARDSSLEDLFSDLATAGDPGGGAPISDGGMLEDDDGEQTLVEARGPSTSTAPAASPRPKSTQKLTTPVRSPTALHAKGGAVEVAQRPAQGKSLYGNARAEPTDRVARGSRSPAEAPASRRPSVAAAAPDTELVAATNVAATAAMASLTAGVPVVTEPQPEPPSHSLADGDDGHELPAVEWQPGSDWFDDDDDDDDVLPAWSLVQRLVREPSPDDGGKKATQVLEVLHYRGESIVDHEVLFEGEAYHFGHRMAREVLRERGIKKPFLLATHRRGHVVELRLAAGVGGQIFRQGQQVDVRALPEAKSKSGKVPLTAGDMAYLDVGGDRVYLRFAKRPKMDLPPELAKRARSERRASVTAFVVALSLWMMMGAVAWIWQYRTHSQRVIQLEDTGFAEIFEKEELELEEPKEPEPEPEPEVAPDPEVKPEPQKAPEVTPDKPKPSVTEMLQKIPKLQGPASSQSLKAAMSNIDGIRVPGAGGLRVSELVGKGPTSNVQIGGAAGGLETSGLNSVIRENTGALGKKQDRAVNARVAKLERQSTVKGQGQLSKEEILKVINQHIGQLQLCYERALRKNPQLHGKVVLEWKIEPSGNVGVVKSQRSTLPSPEAVSCMSSAVKRWKFPKPRGNAPVIVTFPFNFNTL